MNENNNIKLQVLDKIQSGDISMRPKYYFFLKVAAVTLVSFLVLIISSFLVSFVVFSIVQSGRLFLLGFGFSIGLSIIIEYSPIHPLILRRAQYKDGLPIVGVFYRDLRFSIPRQEIFRGYVTDIGTSSFILTEDDDNIPNKTYTVYISADSLDQSDLMFGDMIFVAGRVLPDNSVQAYGVRKLSQ